MKKTIIALTLLFGSCVQNDFKTVDFKEFNEGQILYPDYAHSDTMIVLNADSLNYYIQFAITDNEINEVLKRYSLNPKQSGIIVRRSMLGEFQAQRDVTLSNGVCDALTNPDFK